jgi:hypothetical protein
MAMKIKLTNTRAPPKGQGAAPYSTKVSKVETMYSGRTSGKAADPYKQALSDLNTSGGSSLMPGTRRVVNGS